MSTPAVEVPDGRTLVVAGRAIGWAQLRRGDLPRVRGHVFHIRQAVVPFENGWQVSVVWGTATYSDNHDSVGAPEPFTETPARVEVAVMSPDGGMVDFPGGDSVCGYVPGHVVLDLIDTVGRWPSGSPGPWPAWWTDAGADE